MHSIAWWPTLVVLAVATLSDLQTRRIPNWLVVPFLLAGLGVAIVTQGLAGLGQSVLGVMLAAAVMGLFYVLGGLGMGDVKLCAAIGAWVGPSQMMMALVAIALAGGVVAMVWALSTGTLAESLDSTGNLLGSLRKKGLRPHPELNLKNARARKFPYAPAIAIGTVFSFFMAGK
jgi:prepilin peptidase CpaA